MHVPVQYFQNIYYFSQAAGDNLLRYILGMYYIILEPKPGPVLSYLRPKGIHII